MRSTYVGVVSTFVCTGCMYIFNQHINLYSYSSFDRHIPHTFYLLTRTGMYIYALTHTGTFRHAQLRTGMYLHAQSYRGYQSSLHIHSFLKSNFSTLSIPLIYFNLILYLSSPYLKHLKLSYLTNNSFKNILNNLNLKLQLRKHLK